MKYLERKARAAKRRQEIKTAPPSVPATLSAVKEKQERKSQDTLTVHDSQHDSNVNGVAEEHQWDLLKQMQAIKITRERPQVLESPAPTRTRLAFNYPTIAKQWPNYC